MGLYIKYPHISGYFRAWYLVLVLVLLISC